MVVRSPPQPMWDITIYPPSGPSVLAGTLSFLPSMSDRPPIHPLWGPASLLAHYIVFTPPPPFWGTARRLAHHPVSDSDTICNGPDPPLADIVLFGLPLKALKRVYSFHTLINGGLFSSPTKWDITIHPPSGPSVLGGTLSFLPSMSDSPPIHPLWGPASLLAHRIVSTPPPPWKTTRRLAHRPVSDSDTICNGSDPPLADIVLFGLSLSGFPSRL